jgi:hypothetical protein
MAVTIATVTIPKTRFSLLSIAGRPCEEGVHPERRGESHQETRQSFAHFLASRTFGFLTKTGGSRVNLRNVALFEPFFRNKTSRETPRRGQGLELPASFQKDRVIEVNRRIGTFVFDPSTERVTPFDEQASIALTDDFVPGQQA